MYSLSRIEDMCDFVRLPFPLLRLRDVIAVFMDFSLTTCVLCIEMAGFNIKIGTWLHQAPKLNIII